MFQQEKEMTPVVKTWLKESGFRTKSEFRTPWGVCDLVGCTMNAEAVETRVRLRQTAQLSNTLRATLFSAIPDESRRNGVSLDSLCSTLGNSSLRGRIEHELGKLIDGGFIVQTPTGSFKSRSRWKPLHREVIAIELKLTKVHEVIAQAIMNRSFATQSFLALPEDVVSRMSRTASEKCTEAGIGVIAVSQTGCSIAKEARETSSDEGLQIHLVDRFWSEARKDKAA